MTKIKIPWQIEEQSKYGNVIILHYFHNWITAFLYKLFVYGFDDNMKIRKSQLKTVKVLKK